MSREGGLDQFKQSPNAAQRRIANMVGDINAAAGIKSKPVPQPEVVNEKESTAVETEEVFDDVAEHEHEHGVESLEALDDMSERFADLETAEGRAAILSAAEDNAMEYMYNEGLYQDAPDTFVDSSAYHKLATLQETLRGIETKKAEGESVEPADAAKVETAYKATKQHLPEPSIETPEINTKETHRKLDEVYSKAELTEVADDLDVLDTRVVEMLGTFFTLYPEDDNRPFEVTSYINQLQDLQASIGQHESIINNKKGDAVVTERSLGITYAELQTFIKTTDRTISNLSNVPALAAFEQLRTARTQLEQKTDFVPEQGGAIGDVSLETLPVDDSAEVEMVPDEVYQTAPAIEGLAPEKPPTLVLSNEQRVDPIEPTKTESKFSPTMKETAGRPNKSGFRSFLSATKKLFVAGESSSQAQSLREDPPKAKLELYKLPSKLASPVESESKDEEPVLTGSNSLDWLQRLHGPELGADIYRSKQVLHRLRNQEQSRSDHEVEPAIEPLVQPVVTRESAVDSGADPVSELRTESVPHGQDSLESDILPEVEGQTGVAQVEQSVDTFTPKSVTNLEESSKLAMRQPDTEYEAMNAAWNDVLDTESKPQASETEAEVQQNEKIIQDKVAQIEQSAKGPFSNLFYPYQSPYKVWGNKSVQEVQQWLVLEDSELQFVLDRYQVQRETLERWKNLIPELRQPVSGDTSKTFKAVVDEFLLHQTSTQGT
jgi:hypothetical protein